MAEKISECETHPYNPFLKNIEETYIIQRKDEKLSIPTSLAITDNKGNHISQAFIRQNVKKYSDSRDFIRIPVDGFRAMTDLNPSELKILCYIFEIIKYGELQVDVQVEEVKTFYSYVSRNPIYTGIIGLINKRFIARKKDERSIYFVNPMYFYKGSIVKPFFEYMSRREELEIKYPETKRKQKDAELKVMAQ